MKTLIIFVWSEISRTLRKKKKSNRNYSYRPSISPVATRGTLIKYKKKKLRSLRNINVPGPDTNTKLFFLSQEKPCISILNPFKNGRRNCSDTLQSLSFKPAHKELSNFYDVLAESVTLLKNIFYYFLEIA